MKYFFGAVITAVVLLGGGWYLVSEDASPNEHTETTTAQTDAETITIATSFYPLEYALNRLVGDAGTVVNIGADTDPHDFTPTTKDMVTLRQADIVVLQGADFEPWGDDIITRLEADTVPVVLATTDLTLRTANRHTTPRKRTTIIMMRNKHTTQHPMIVITTNTRRKITTKKNFLSTKKQCTLTQRRMNTVTMTRTRGSVMYYSAKLLHTSPMN